MDQVTVPVKLLRGNRITVPAYMVQALNLGKNRKALITVKGNNIFIKAAPEL